MKKLNIDNKSDFEIYLSDYDTSIKEIRKKLVIEQTWNKMIFEIYKDKITIDEKKITQTLDSLIEEKGKQKSFKLYEIVFSQKNKENFKKKLITSILFTPKFQKIINSLFFSYLPVM